MIRIELLVRRSSRKDFFSKECITFESLEKNHFFLKSQEKIENSYLKNENSHYQVMHERVLLEKITFVLIFWEDKPFHKSQKKNENPCDKNEDSSYQNGIFWDIFFSRKNDYIYIFWISFDKKKVVPFDKNNPINETKNFKKIILIVFTGGNTRFITALTDFYRYQLSTFIHSCVVSLS